VQRRKSGPQTSTIDEGESEVQPMKEKTRATNNEGSRPNEPDEEPDEASSVVEEPATKIEPVAAALLSNKTQASTTGSEAQPTSPPRITSLVAPEPPPVDDTPDLMHMSVDDHHQELHGEQQQEVGKNSVATERGPWRSWLSRRESNHHRPVKVLNDSGNEVEVEVQVEDHDQFFLGLLAPRLVPDSPSRVKAFGVKNEISEANEDFSEGGDEANNYVLE